MSGQNEIWIKAAAAGGLWACMEIVVGSFLHNLHLPFAGSILAALVLVFLVAVHELWPDKGLIWRAGLICAAMKSLSPGVVIIGPMFAIIAEAMLFELGLRVCGRNLAGYLLGGALAMTWLPMQKIGRLLLFYGSDMIDVTVATFIGVQQFLGVTALTPGQALIALILLYPVTGMLAVICGWNLGQRIKNLPPAELTIKSTDGNAPVFTAGVRHNLVLLPLHIVAVISGMILLNFYPLGYGALFVFCYIALCAWRYPSLCRRFSKPGFWVFFVFITLLAGVFLGSFAQQDGELFSAPKVEHLMVGVQMNVRAALLLAAFFALGIELNHPRIRKFLRARGCDAYSRALQSAFEVMPLMLETMMQQGFRLHNPINRFVYMLQHLEFWRGQLQAISAPPVFILTGGRGSGKTAALQMLSSEITRKNLRVCGILARGLWHHGQRSGFDIVDINTGVQTPLCRRDIPATGVQSGSFQFHAAGLAAGKTILQRAATARADVVIIDEVGPLELRGEGWAKELEELLKKQPCPLVLSVRPSLVETVARYWGVTPAAVWDVDTTGIAQMLIDLNLHAAERLRGFPVQKKQRSSV
ncbi:MAG: nucleoside-triphosphatase [Desulfuromonadaceae bacterium]|nr:nucleoside-triphosphatase [Desulfuromonadaceae bacterium]